MQSIQLHEGSKWGNVPFTNQPINQKIILTVAAIALSTFATSYYFNADQGLSALTSRVQQAIPSGSSLAVIAFCGVLCWANYLYSAKCLADTAATNDKRHADLACRLDDLNNRIEGLANACADRAKSIPSTEPAPVVEVPVDPAVEQPARTIEVPPYEILFQQFKDLFRSENPADHIEARTARNRWSNVIGYDKTWYRHGVNANWIGEKEAIATQGPMDNDIGFWGMVFDSGTNVVVSLGDFMGGAKFHPFWDDKQVGDFKISVGESSLIEDSGFRYISSIITIQRGEEKKQITHFYFMDWPDGGVAKVEHLGKLVKMIAASEYKLPIVHCSAGIGRTGTFLAVYIAYLRNGKNSGSNQPRFNIEDAVTMLRDPSSGRTEDTVQTLEQYVLAWETLAWLLLSKGSRSSSSDAEVGPPAAPSDLDEEYQRLRRRSVDPEDFAPDVDSSYRGTHVGGRLSANYIGSRNRPFAIAAEGPKRDDAKFWNMIFKSETNAVVSLGPHENGGNYYPFWEDKRVGDFNITVSEPSLIEGAGFRCTKRIITIQNREGEKQITHFLFDDWQGDVAKIEHLGRFIEIFAAGQYTQPVVHCSNGNGKTGTFLAAYMIYVYDVARKIGSNRLQGYTTIQAVDTLRNPHIGRNPYMVETEEQYKLVDAVQRWLKGRIA